MIETLPAGASVTTDLETRESRMHRAQYHSIPPEYYGCAPTPCSFDLPRRSDFNVMVTKDGFQPFTWAVTKDHNRLTQKETSRGNVALGLTTGAATAGYGWINAAAVGTPVAPAIAGTAVIIGAFAVPTAGAAGMVDMASGALIDLHPNPLQVKLAPEESPEDTASLTGMFESARARHNAGRH